MSEDAPRPAVPGFHRAQSAFQEDQRRRSVRYRCVRLVLLHVKQVQQLRLRWTCRERPEEVFTARDEANLVYVAKNFAAKEGVRLNSDLVVGKHLSSGLQGGVYLVNDNNGNEVDLVVKVPPLLGQELALCNLRARACVCVSPHGRALHVSTF